MKYTKSGMLRHLKEHIPPINILPILTVKSVDFMNNEHEVIKSVLEFANGKPIIVRSSSVAEDTEEYSNAGRFESILNVTPDTDEIRDAIEKVYQSYGTDSDEEILIQPVLDNIQKSGVVFTADMNTFADYYTVNFYEGNDSAAVTSGSSSGLRTFVCYKY